MARRFTHRPARSAPSPRQSIWLGLNVATTTIPAGAGVLAGVVNAAALALRPFTVIRTRLELMWESDQIVTSETPRGSAALLVVSDTASALGITAIPTPTTDIGNDWFMWQGLLGKFIDASTVGFESNGGTRYHVDSKAMRKVGEGEDMVYVAEGVGFGGLLTTVGRILVKLH